MLALLPESHLKLSQMSSAKARIYPFPPTSFSSLWLPPQWNRGAKCPGRGGAEETQP